MNAPATQTRYRVQSFWLAADGTLEQDTEYAASEQAAYKLADETRCCDGNYAVAVYYNQNDLIYIEIEGQEKPYR